MRKVLVFTICFISMISAEEMILTITASTEHLTVLDSSLGQSFRLPGAPPVARPGTPSLPMKPFYIVLPYGAVVDSFKITGITETSLPGRFDIKPAQVGVPLSKPEDFSLTSRIAEAYMKPDQNPVICISGQGRLMGIEVADLAFRPITWNPLTGKAHFRESVDFILYYHLSETGHFPVRRSAFSTSLSENIVRAMVINPWDVEVFSTATVTDVSDLPYGEYLIITPESFVDVFEELAEYKTKKGVPACIVTTETINELYTGVDEAQSIRHFLRAIYEDSPPAFILLGGDTPEVDHRNCYATAEGYEGDPSSDIYYQDMNDTAPGIDCWDYDNDGVWGELDDDIMDYHPDYLIGRAAVQTVDEAQIFIDKIIAYEDGCDSEAWFTSMGFTTGILWSSPYCPGSAGKEKIDDLYTPESWKPVEKHYASAGTQSYALTMDMLNRGQHLVNHADHGSTTGVAIGSGYLGMSDFMGLTNISSHDRVSIWNTIACNSGGFDLGNCLAEAWINSPGGGGFCMMNTRYGWGEPTEPGNQWSELVDQEFFAKFFIEDMFYLGQAHAMAKDEFIALIPSDTHYDWIAKSLTLFGDPELPMWTAPPAGDLQVEAPEQINTGSVEVQIIVSDDNGLLENARVCLLQGEWDTPNVYEVGYTDGAGQVVFCIDSQEEGILIVTGWARNHAPVSVDVDVTDLGIVEGFSPDIRATFLGMPVPNPSFGSISFEWANNSGKAEIMVIDMSGRIVCLLESDLSGSGTVQWDCTGDDGSMLPMGIYMINMKSDGFSSSHRIVILR